MKNVVKRMLLFGASVFESVTVDACFTDNHAFNERVDVGKEVYRGNTSPIKIPSFW